MAINWGIDGATQGFQNALALGAQIGDVIARKREDNALAAFVTNPGKESLAGLAKVNPGLAFQAQGVMQRREAEQRKAQQEQLAAGLRVKASQGDPAALQQLVGIDFDSWKSLDTAQKQMIKGQTDYIGQAGLRISQLKPEQQPAAWDQAIDQGVQMGYKGLADYKGKFSPQALSGAIDNAGLVDKFIQLAEPKYMAVPEGGTLVNTRNPQAVAGFGASAAPKQIGSRAEYDALPAGSEYIAPDGSVKRKGGGSGNATGGFPASGIGG